MKGLQLAGAIIAAVSLIVILAGAILLMGKIRRIGSWLPAEAQVLSSTAKYTQEENETSHIVYRFRYSASGSEQVAEFVSTGDNEDLAERLARHPAGSTGRVFFNPENPQQVDPNLGYNAATLTLSVCLLGGGLALLVFACMFLLLGRPSAEG